MMLETVPIMGQLSLLAMSVGLNITFIILIARGILNTRAQIDQVQKTADTFQRAWEIEKEINQGQAETLNKLVVTGDTTLQILQSRPSQPPKVGGSQ